jgi:putative FmdB family regulatory protein
MPTYEYCCGKCGHEFEEFRKMSDAPATRCPKCGGKVKRVISGGSGVIFKGSGFYITDYARKSSKTHDTGGVADPKKDTSPKETKKKDGPATTGHQS